MQKSNNNSEEGTDSIIAFPLKWQWQNLLYMQTLEVLGNFLYNCKIIIQENKSKFVSLWGTKVVFLLCISSSKLCNDHWREVM